MPTASSHGALPAHITLLSGAAAGVVSRTCTAPFDRLKVLMQADGIAKGTGAITGLRELIRTQGLKSMWNGQRPESYGPLDSLPQHTPTSAHAHAMRIQSLCVFWCSRKWGECRKGGTRVGPQVLCVRPGQGCALPRSKQPTAPREIPVGGNCWRNLPGDPVRLLAMAVPRFTVSLAPCSISSVLIYTMVQSADSHLPSRGDQDNRDNRTPGSLRKRDGLRASVNPKRWMACTIPWTCPGNHWDHPVCRDRSHAVRPRTLRPQSPIPLLHWDFP